MRLQEALEEAAEEAALNRMPSKAHGRLQILQSRVKQN